MSRSVVHEYVEAIFPGYAKRGQGRLRAIVQQNDAGRASQELKRARITREGIQVANATVLVAGWWLVVGYIRRWSRVPHGTARGAVHRRRPASGARGIVFDYFNGPSRPKSMSTLTCRYRNRSNALGGLY